ncbi:MAG TPA: hypothetical protein VGP22_06205 [Albitalea sp.]|nr:hypothetical protein [Albitalea sp.]
MTQPTQPVGKYQPPTSGPTAKLVMRATVPEGDLYGVFMLDDAERCGGHRMVGTGDTKRNPLTTTVAANRLQTLEFRLIKPSKQVCAVRWSFTPLAGKSYLLRAGTQTGGCVALVMDMSNPEQIKLEPTALRRNPGTSSCMPLSQSKGVTAAEADAGKGGQDAVLREGAGTEDLQGLMGR